MYINKNKVTPKNDLKKQKSSLFPVTTVLQKIAVSLFFHDHPGYHDYLNGLSNDDIYSLLKASDEKEQLLREGLMIGFLF